MLLRSIVEKMLAKFCFVQFKFIKYATKPSVNFLQKTTRQIFLSVRLFQNFAGEIMYPFFVKVRAKIKDSFAFFGAAFVNV